MGKPATDAEIFTILELRDSGLPFSRIGERVGRKRNEVLGIYHRITKAAEPADEFDGTMPYGWWKEGLRKQNG